MRRAVEQLVEEKLAPLIAVDGGKITVLTANDARVELHLSAACAGCPGLAYTRDEIIVPLVREVVGEGVVIDVHSRRLPKARVDEPAS